MLFRSIVLAAGLAVSGAVEPIDVSAICDVAGAIKIGIDSTDDFVTLETAWGSKKWPEGTVFLIRGWGHTLTNPITINVAGIKICGDRLDIACIRHPG
jgi:hypothetical protein